jgi:regulation of enolase protein 1 (concanavalin A-like superfamily)
MLTVFPDGELQFGSRTAVGAEVAALPTANAEPKDLRLRLDRQGGKIRAYYAAANGEWKSLGEIPDRLPKRVRAGALALSHDNQQLVRIVYRGLKVTPL